MEHTLRNTVPVNWLQRSTWNTPREREGWTGYTGKNFNNLLSKERKKQQLWCLPISMVWTLSSWLIGSHQHDINEHRPGQRAHTLCQDTTHIWGAQANSQRGEWWAERKQPSLSHSPPPRLIFPVTNRPLLNTSRSKPAKTRIHWMKNHIAVSRICKPFWEQQPTLKTLPPPV